MSVDKEAWRELRETLLAREATLVAVSKTKPAEDIRALYDLGQRDFGENYVQELCEKQSALPADIRWHFIGHLQSNKVKYIASFVHLIQGVDGEKLLREIDRQAARHDRVIDCLLQVHIAREETKFGFSEEELTGFLRAWPGYRDAGELKHVRLRGLMGMASLTQDAEETRREFRRLRALYDLVRKFPGGENFSILSMGMSGDYRLALDEGSNMVRIGSLLFGSR